MNKIDKAFAAVVVLAIILICLTLLLSNGANAEIKLSEAPLEYQVINFQRVDINLKNEPMIACMDIPFLEMIDDYLVVITDGYHIISNWFCVESDQSLAALFRASDLKRLDGTVGVYLIWLAKTEHTEN